MDIDGLQRRVVTLFSRLQISSKIQTILRSERRVVELHGKIQTFCNGQPGLPLDPRIIKNLFFFSSFQDHFQNCLLHTLRQAPVHIQRHAASGQIPHRILQIGRTTVQ